MSFDLDHRQVGERVCPREGPLEGSSVRESHLQPIGTLHDVVIGQYVAVRADYHP